MGNIDHLLKRLERPPVFMDDIRDAQECDPESLLNELDALLQQLGFLYFSYTAIPRDISSVGGIFLLTRRAEGRGGLGTLPDAITQAYYRDIASRDPLWQLLPKAEIGKPCLVRYKQATGYSAVHSFWASHGVGSQLHLPLPGRHDAYWFSCFSLYHSLDEDKFLLFCSSVQAWLESVLLRFHQRLQAISKSPINPYLSHELLSPTCLHIMRMTAEGLPVKRIAVQLALTEEGVTYHITRAKNVLRARNKTHLIALLYEVGVL